MTRQESFKRRIRQRMAKTGERYVAARRTLLDQAGPSRAWVSDPDTSNESVKEATGRDWDEWAELIDAWGGDVSSHPAIVAFVHEEHGVPGWWAQQVTVGYERIRGLRQKNQRQDGTFYAAKTKTVGIDADALRAMLLDDDDRADLFGGMETELRSKPESKALRIGIGGGVAQLSLDRLDDGRTRVSVAHEKLAEPADVDTWKAYWTEWLEALVDE